MELETVIGLEIHAKFHKTKMFCSCLNDSFGKSQLKCLPVCMAFRDASVVNKSGSKGAIAALALKCSLPKHSKFDRKNYFC